MKFSQTIISITMFMATQLAWAENISDNRLTPFWTDKCGFINQKGEVVIKPQFDSVGFFNKSGFAAVKLGEKWGFIDTTGKLITKVQFDTDEYINFGNGLWGVIQDKKKGMIDKKGKIVVPPKFDDAYILDRIGLVVVRQGVKLGMMNKEGQLTTAIEFDHIYSFDRKLEYAKVEQNKKWGIINKNGRVTIKPQFDRIQTILPNSNLVIINNEKYGVADKNGKMIVTPEFDEIDVNSDILVAKKFHEEPKWYHIFNHEGRFLNKFNYLKMNGYRITNKELAIAAVGNESYSGMHGQYGYIDEKGNIAIALQFEDANLFENGIAKVKKNGKWGLSTQKASGS
ncbi:hypothetical protein FACS189441_5300 [Betaproteobacteria bacterium]|nr:hypothetical protein FACS189441_5300 [Betaproteobacteria bacterium]